MSDIDTYLKNVTSSQKKTLESIRKLVKQTVPEAEESISYGVPTFKVRNHALLYFAAYKNHMSLYPASDEMIESIGHDIAKHRTGRGTLQFSETNPIPEPVIKKIILFRLATIPKVK